jgi:secondary thiamine-phosphate synthase enzyme
MIESSAIGSHVHRRALLRHEDKATVTAEAIEIETKGAPEFHDITDDIFAIIQDSGVTYGQATVFSEHTTAAIRINENEPLLLKDMARTLRQIAPPDAYYEHNDFGRRTVNMNIDECANGHSHCQHLFLSSSETIPVIDGKPALGTYQRVFLIELDHPRMRRVLVTVVGC